MPAPNPGRSRRPQSLVVLAAGLLAIASGVSLICLKLSKLTPSGGGVESRRTATPQAPAPGPDPPVPPPEFFPPEAFFHRLRAAAGREVLFERGKEAILAAAAFYGRAEHQADAAARAQGDAKMLEGLDLLRQAGALVPELRAYFHETVDALWQRGELAETERRLRLWLQGFPDDPYALQLLADVLGRARKWPDAALVCERILAERPRDADVLKLAAVAYKELQRWPQAAAAAARHAALAPRRPRGPPPPRARRVRDR
jgi:tetratricopeptide (TPR) repeat protein